MSTLAIPLNIPVGNGVSAPVSTSALDSFKSIVVTGTFVGVVTVEIANGSDFCPIASFTASGYKAINVVASQMRVRVEGLVSGSVDSVDVVAEDSTIDVDTLAVPASVPGGVSVGASTDVSAYGSVTTVNIAGAFVGNFILEISPDNTNFAPVLAFNKPTCKTIRVPAQFMRLRRFSTVTDLGTPTCEVGFSSGMGGSVGPPSLNYSNVSINGTPAAPADGNPIPYDNVLMEEGISWDTVNNDVTLGGNTGTYLMLAAMRIINPLNLISTYAWRDDTAGVNVGSQANNNSMNRNVTASNQQIAVAFVTPLVDTTYFVEQLSGGGGPGTAYNPGDQSWALVLRIAP